MLPSLKLIVGFSLLLSAVNALNATEFVKSYLNGNGHVPCNLLTTTSTPTSRVTTTAGPSTASTTSVTTAQTSAVSSTTTGTTPSPTTSKTSSTTSTTGKSTTTTSVPLSSTATPSLPTSQTTAPAPSSSVPASTASSTYSIPTTTTSTPGTSATSASTTSPTILTSNGRSTPLSSLPSTSLPFLYTSTSSPTPTAPESTTTLSNTYSTSTTTVPTAPSTSSATSTTTLDGRQSSATGVPTTPTGSSSTSTQSSERSTVLTSPAVAQSSTRTSSTSSSSSSPVSTVQSTMDAPSTISTSMSEKSTAELSTTEVTTEERTTMGTVTGPSTERASEEPTTVEIEISTSLTSAATSSSAETSASTASSSTALVSEESSTPSSDPAPTSAPTTQISLSTPSSSTGYSNTSTTVASSISTSSKKTSAATTSPSPSATEKSTPSSNRSGTTLPRTATPSTTEKTTSSASSTGSAVEETTVLTQTASRGTSTVSTSSSTSSTATEPLSSSSSSTTGPVSSSMSTSSMPSTSSPASSSTRTTPSATTESSTPAAETSQTTTSFETAQSTSATSTSSPATTTQYCEDRCPNGTLEGKVACFELMPEFFAGHFLRAVNYCGRAKTGHLILATEVMAEARAIKAWLTGQGLGNASVYIYARTPAKEPFTGRAMGRRANVSDLEPYNLPMEFIGLREEVQATIGICAIPPHCGNFPCSLDPLYEAFPGQLQKPQPAPLSTGETARISCTAPSTTVLRVRCDSYGFLRPTPGSEGCDYGHSFNQEEETPANNKTFEGPCSWCYAPGTERCRTNGRRSQCQCKKGWMKNLCWKSPDMCWVPEGAEKKCLNKGKCSSIVDYHTCTCPSWYGGERCQLYLYNISTWGSDDTVAWMSATKIAVGTVTSFEIVKLLMIFIPFVATFFSPSPADPQQYIYRSRTLLFAAAFSISLAFSSPAYWVFNTFNCRTVYFVVHVLFGWAFWFALLEAGHVFLVHAGVSRNRWFLAAELLDDDQEYKAAPPVSLYILSPRVVVLAPMLLIFAWESFVVGGFWDSIPTRHTCLGLLSLNNFDSLVQVSIYGGLTFLTVVLGWQALRSHSAFPEKLADNLNYWEVHGDLSQQDQAHRFARIRYQQLLQSPLLYWLYVALVHSQDSVKYTTVQPEYLQTACYVLVAGNILVSLWNGVAYSPQCVEALMCWFIGRFPSYSSWMPMVTPFNLLSHVEIRAIHTQDASLVTENYRWPVNPWDEDYLSLERRHLTGRSMTRGYLLLRMQNMSKETAVTRVQRIGINRFPRSDPCRPQWLLYIRRWGKQILAADTHTMKLPRTRPQDETDRTARVTGAWMFSQASLINENCGWERYRLLYDILGYVPLEDELVIIEFNHLFRWMWTYRHRDVTATQIRHWSQFPEWEQEWEKIQEFLRARGEDPIGEGRSILPEFFAEGDEIKPNLLQFPEAKRYLKVEFLNRLIFQTRKVQEQVNELVRQRDAQPGKFFYGKTRISAHPLQFLWGKLMGEEVEEDIPEVYENLETAEEIGEALNKLDEDLKKQEAEPQIVQERAAELRDEAVIREELPRVPNDVVYLNREVERPQRVPPVFVGERLPEKIFRF